MSIPRYLLSSSMLSGAVFCACTLPMAALDSKPVTIQIDDDPLFVGQLNELAAPYLGLATAASLGMGVMSFSVMGWSQSSGKLSQSKDEIEKLQKELRERESLVEQLKFSDARLEASGLSSFIEDDGLEHDLVSNNHAVAHPVDTRNTSGTPANQPQPYEVYYHVSHSAVNGDRPTTAPRHAAKPPLPPKHHAQNPAAPVMTSGQPQNGARPAATPRPPLPPKHHAQNPAAPVMTSGQPQNGARPTATPRHATKPPLPPKHHAQNLGTAMPPAQNLNGSFQPVTSQQKSVEIPANLEHVSPENSDQLNDLLSQIQQVMVKVEKLQQGDSTASTHYGYNSLSSSAA